jgi:dTDP-4-amino-4,6-dideoxygalactose transaminase
MKKLQEYKNIFFKEHLHFVGSGSTALFIFIKHNNVKNKRILCPSNICYSVPYAILASGNIPLFYDINPISGNPDYKSIKETIDKNNNIFAAIIPHMYGNPVEERGLIGLTCKKNSIKIIDDCAASIGIQDVNGYIKAESDAVIFSFATNKHIDLGAGGVLAMNEKIDINLYDKYIENDLIMHKIKTEMLDKIYKPIFYSEYYFDLIENLNTFNSFFQNAFIYKFQPDTFYLQKLFQQLNELKSNIKYRQETIDYINDHINYNQNFIEKYIFNTGSNPWRFNILIANKKIRMLLIKKMLKNTLPVSIWYPPIDSIYGYKIQQNSKVFSDKILNFDFINASKKQIDIFIDLINTFEEKKEFDE